MNLELEPLESEIKNSQPAKFEAQPLKTRYTGLEHRVKARRVTTDRRAATRYEPGKADRRSNNDRRMGNNWNNVYSI